MRVGGEGGDWGALLFVGSALFAAHRWRIIISLRKYSKIINKKEQPHFPRTIHSPCIVAFVIKR
jgi:hypothetical protein